MGKHILKCNRRTWANSLSIDSQLRLLNISSGIQSIRTVGRPNMRWDDHIKKFYENSFLGQIGYFCQVVFKYLLFSYLEEYCFGESQWAFRKESSVRDLLTVLVSTWIRAIGFGFEIGGYFNDVAGVFDRADKEYIMMNFFSIGVSDQFLDSLNSYFEPRIGRVIVEGVFSDTFDLCNMIYALHYGMHFFMILLEPQKDLEDMHQFSMTI